MYAITFKFSNNCENTLSNEDYNVVCNWWRIFSTDEAMKDIGIIEMIFFNTENKVIAAKCGPMPAAA